MTRRLYVGNLPYDATEKQVRQVFETADRKVVSIKIVIDKDTGKPRGFAFVDLETPEQAKSAIDELNGRDFSGRALIVNEAEDKGPKEGKSGPPEARVGPYRVTVEKVTEQQYARWRPRRDTG